MHMYCHLSLIILLLFVPFLFVIYNRQGIAFLVHVFIIEDLIQLTFFGEPFAYFILYQAVILARNNHVHASNLLHQSPNLIL
jgi:uncharacterized membrane protein